MRALLWGWVEQYLSGEYTLNTLTARGDVVAAKVKELENLLTAD